MRLLSNVCRGGSCLAGRQAPGRSCIRILIVIFLSLSPLLFAAPELVDPLAWDAAPEAMVVTAHPLATEAAIKILQEGGNAVDAAVAAQWVLNVVEPQSSGLGGGGFFVYYDAEKKSIHTFDGREKAPARAFPEMFLDEDDTPIPFYPDRITGGLPVGVPGTLRLLKRVHDRFGSKKFRFEQLFEPAIDLARKGAPVSKALAQAIQSEAGRLRRFEASRQIFFRPDGEPFREGEILVQEDLAKAFETIAQKGIGSFYEGKIAQGIVRAVQEAPFHPGLLDDSDLVFYDVVEREPIHGNYRGFDIFSMGPPSSGGVALIEILNILENFSLVFYGPSADTFHLVIEAQKIAFEDRAEHLGDPDAVKIPLEKLLSKDHAKKKAKEIKFEEAKTVEALVKEASRPGTGNTSHLSIWDSEGNVVSYTTTIEHVFGSGVVVPGLGFVLNNELTDFDAEPRGDFGFVDKIAPKGHVLNSSLKALASKPRANAPGPEKRPRSSMTPVIVFRNGEPFVVAGSPGGSLIIPTIQEILMYLLDFRMQPDQAVASPRFAARGAVVEAEAPFFDSPKIIEELKNRGHVFEVRPPFGNAQTVFYDKDSETLMGVSDPRGIGRPQGF